MDTRIAVIGAGVGGLTLARALHTHGVGVAIFERDGSPAARTQGGSLDLHPESGQRAIADAGLTEGFWAIARPEGEELRIVDPTGTTLVRKVPPPGTPAGRPEVDRSALRDLLLCSLPRDTVRWARALRTADARADGGYELRFADGSQTDCDLLVGADGGRSRVRRLVSDAEPIYTGSAYVELRITEPARSHADLDAMVGPGSLWALGVDRNIAAQRNGDGSIRVMVSLRVTEEWVNTFAARRTAREDLLDLFDGWDSRMTAAIAGSADEPVPRGVYALPADLRWEHRFGVTLIGDAAHLMPPVGEGANHAMLDGVELARRIVARPEDLDTALREYETTMFDRANAVAADSADMEAMILSPTAAQDMARFFCAAI